MMNSISKTLYEMTLAERSSLLDTVATALEATAEEAEGQGDARFASNSICVANTIRGMSGSFGSRDLAAAELLVEQGIMLVHQFSNRATATTLH
jgi:HPt (histidine-containing phosphotransfer) domain-containing protein